MSKSGAVRSEWVSTGSTLTLLPRADSLEPGFSMATSSTQPTKTGLGPSMQQVLELADKVGGGFKSGPVHDLRTALRRCRSMAEGAMVFDADPAWKKMRKAGKQLFKSLGALRDTHVLIEWIEKLAPSGDTAGEKLQSFLQSREKELEGTAATALEQFDRHRWNNWSSELPLRLAKIPADSPLLAHLALERWQEARALHRRALRNRTNVAWHELRIGIKHFRYIVENFLPSLHEFWGADLKEMQDALGDVHDLDVLWATARAVKAFPDQASRETWQSRIQERRSACLEQYRGKMVGRGSLWATCRSALPKEEQLRHLGRQRFALWASFLDPDIRHARHVTRLSLQILDGMRSSAPKDRQMKHRYILEAAALMHDVGRFKTNKGHHKESARLIRKVQAPLGWSASEITTAALIARYHRGALPNEAQQRFARLSKSKRWLVQFLGGILRLACACDTEHKTQIRKLEVESTDSVLTFRAEGYEAESPSAEHLATARYLLELASHRPVFIAPSRSHVA
jgi:CHAD domain-containing protein